MRFRAQRCLIQGGLKVDGWNYVFNVEYFKQWC